MKNEKPKNQRTINDILNESKVPHMPFGKRKQGEEFEVDAFSKEQIKAFNDYNEKVTEIDPLYASLKPRHRNVILRVFLRSFSDDDPLANSKVDVLRLVSKANHGFDYGQVNNPLPYTTKAVVVSVPNEDWFDIKQGDIVKLKTRPVVLVQQQEGGRITVPNTLIHPDNIDKYDDIVFDPASPDYGYLLISEDEISLIIK